MSAKGAKEKLQEFLDAQPSWFQKFVRRDSAWSVDEWKSLAGTHPDVWLQMCDQYESIIRRIPAEWKAYRQKRVKEFLASLPTGQRGRPRKDVLAEEARNLHSEGKSYAQIAHNLNLKYGADTTKPEAIRKLIKSRENLSPKKK